MNVLILNEQQNQLQSIEVDIIKSVTGKFDASDIVNMFKDFFFNKMILDVTALNDFDNPTTYKTIAEGINPDKLIFFLQEGSELCTSGFLSCLINIGIYNFTTNLDGAKYLVKKSNTLKDVESILKMAQNAANNQNVQQSSDNENISQEQQTSKENATTLAAVPIGNQPIIVGFENVTSHAGATSLIYMIKKELNEVYRDGIYAIELDRNDFLSYSDKSMISTTTQEVNNLINKLKNAKIILIDLNDTTLKDLCTTTIYLMEPSTIKLNTLMRKNKSIISTLKDKDVVLNKSLLSSKDISEFEYESNIKVLYNMPPLNDRKRNEVIVDFLKKIRLLNSNTNNNSSGKIFGLFRK